MPGVDGWGTLAALKSDPELSDIPVVMVTMTEDRRTAYALGACDYLVKPVDPGRLARLLKRHSANRPGGSVLVIDDDPAARAIMRRLLANEGMRVTEADGGRAAIDRLSQETPDLIVLDLVMPDMDGFEVAGAAACLTELGTDSGRRGHRQGTVLAGAHDPQRVGRARPAENLRRLRGAGAGRARLRAGAVPHPGGRVMPWPPSSWSKTTKPTGTCCPAVWNGAATPSRSRRTAGTASRRLGAACPIWSSWT